jgi:hypothetical protein
MLKKDLDMRKFAVLAFMALVLACTDAAAQTVTVVRGSTPSAQRERAPVVLRGTLARPDPAPVEPVPTVYAVAGSTLWLIDSNGGVAGCTLRGSGIVGRNIIHCTNGVLSR